MADAVLEVSLSANEQLLQELIGNDTMYETLMKLMEPKLILRDKIKMEEGLREGRQEGIRGTVDILRDLGHEDAEIKTAIIKKYALTNEAAEKYL